MSRQTPHKAPAYLAFVREQDCCWCQHAAPSDAHHFGPRGIGQKADDLHAVPLCTKCHRYFHDHGTFEGATREQTALRTWRAQALLHVVWFRTRMPAVKVKVSTNDNLGDDKLSELAKCAALSFGEFAGHEGEERFIAWGRRLVALLNAESLAVVEVTSG